MKLIFLHGMPGVGKLTVARELAKLTDFGVFHNHLTVDLLTSVFDFGTVPFIDLRERIWLDVFSTAAKSGIPGVIFTFAFEPTVTPGFVNEVQRAVESNGGEVMFVKLQCAPDELERRVISDSRNAFGKLSSLEEFRKLETSGAFKDPGLTNDRMVIDTTDLSPDKTARLIAEELKLV
jgi:SpoU rRNA methylase family enzyme